MNNLTKKAAMIVGLFLIAAFFWGTASVYELPLPILFNFMFGVFVFIGYSYLAIIQFNEVMRPKDWLTSLRIQIFSVLMLSILTFIPSLVYQYIRLVGDESDFLRAVVSYTGRISSVCILIILIAIFRYKRNEGEK